MASMLTLTMATSVLLIWDNENLENVAVENSYAITKALTPNFVKMLLLDSPDAALEAIEMLRSFQTVKKVYFFDLDNKPIFQYHQSEDANHVDDTPDITTVKAIEVANDFIHILQPIDYSGKYFGKVYLVLSKDFIKKWEKATQERILVFIFVTIIFAIIFAKLVEPLITNSITKLAKEMQLVKEGHDFERRIHTDEKSEIGQLYDGFNQLLYSVQQYSKDLKDHKYAMDQAAIISKTDLKGQITYCNEKFVGVSGFSKEELIGKNHRILKSKVHDEAFYKHLWKTISSGNVWKGEICNIAKDGSYYWVDSTIVPFLNEEGKPIQYISIRYLITDLKDTQERLNKINIDLEEVIDKRTIELENSNDRLLQSEKMASLGGLVAGIAHEVNTPIGVGVTAASHLQDAIEEIKDKVEDSSMTRRDLSDFIEETEDSSRIILGNLERAALLIRSFKQVAVDQTAEDKRLFNMHDYLDEIVLSLRPTLKKTQHKVIIDCDNSIEIESYPGAFSQIITNFVSNSLRYAFDDDEVGELKISCHKKLDRLYLEYSDNGRGVDADALKKLFDPFYTTGRSIGGSGLGMHIVFNLVNQNLLGHIKAESEVGKGLKFLIDIPLDS